MGPIVFARVLKSSCTARMAISIKVVLLLSIYHLQGIGAIHFCEDRSGTIQHGIIECLTNPWHHPQYTCDIKCDLGYVAQPTKQMLCISNGRRVWRENAQGHQEQVYSGTWTSNIDEARCAAPTSCQDILPEDRPAFGNVKCTLNVSSKTCIRTCEYPYEVTEPEFQKEYCGPETNFVWSHVYRHNSTKMPPCAASIKCRSLQESDKPEHAQMACRFEQWADTTICDLQCERGYVPKATSKSFEFCGPTTAFIWSHVHEAKNSYARIGGCEQSLITTEVTMTIDRSCESINESEKHQAAEKFFAMIDLEMINSKLQLNTSLIDWTTYCNSRVVHQPAIDEQAATADVSNNENINQGITDAKTGTQDKLIHQESALPDTVDGVFKNQGENVQIVLGFTKNPLEIDDEPISLLQRGASSQEEAENAVISDLTFSFNYKVECEHGKCQEACAALDLLGDDRCLDVCVKKATSAAQQVRHLKTARIDHFMKTVDVSNVHDVIHGAKFKALNVTSVSSVTYTPTQQEIDQMKINDLLTNGQYQGQVNLYNGRSRNPYQPSNQPVGDEC